jgi:hypothetical protein
MGYVRVDHDPADIGQGIVSSYPAPSAQRPDQGFLHQFLSLLGAARQHMPKPQ